jgi:gamma-glutamylcyclotransferase (GGCT)/AIG2-like uncharacterized protein YtfP
MKNTHNELPLFVYGTLRNDRKYSADVKRYNPEIKPAYCYGNLYYNDFIDEAGSNCVTVALDPSGAQRVKGQLFTFNSNNYYQMLSEFDDKEFNFCNLSKTGNEDIKNRMYLRSVVNCITQTGVIVQAYSYIYVSKIYPLNCHPPVKEDMSFDVEVEYPQNPLTHNEYLEKFDELSRKFKTSPKKR